MAENSEWRSRLKSRLAEIFDGIDLSPEQRAEFHRRLEHCMAALEREREKEPDGSIDLLSTRIRQAEERLVQARKMETIGRLTGAVAHDFNNYLTGILGYSSLLKTRLPESGKEHEAAANIERSARRASELTRQLIAYSRRVALGPRPIDLRRILGEAPAILSRRVSENVEIRTECGEIPEFVTGDAEWLTQALVDLGINAADAMPDGGVLTFSTSLFHSEGEIPAYNAVVPEGRYLSVSVSDTGAGIPESIRDQVFTPFFTTKPPEKAAGLGLPMVRSCVRAHGGYLRLLSREGKGTTVQILLPLDPSRN